MLRPLPLLLMASLSFATQLYSAEEPPTPREAQDVIDTFKSLFGCEASVKTVKVLPKSHLKIVQDGTETTNEDLDGFDELTVVTLSGHGMGSPATYGDRNAPDGVHICLIARSHNEKAATGEPVALTRKFFASFSSPHEGGSARSGVAASGVFEFNCNSHASDESKERTLTIKMKPETKAGK